MKALLFIATLFVSQVALAYPAVGDYARLSGEITVPSGSIIPVTIEFEITSFDPSVQRFTVRTTTDLAGQITVQERLASERDLVLQAEVQETLAQCDVLGGSKTSRTVPAGTFDVCSVPDTDGKSSSNYAVGDIPFGVVMSESVSETGTRTVLQLQEVRFGKN